MLRMTFLLLILISSVSFMAPIVDAELVPTAILQFDPIASDTEARAALDEAIRYASYTFEAEDGRRTGIPYKLGGRTTIDEFSLDIDAGDKHGVDASGLVVVAYRSVFPGLRFRVGEGEPAFRRDVTSSLLYEYNIERVDLEAARPGDLIFFTGSTGTGIAGVAIFERLHDDVVHYVVPSANQGRVIRTFSRVEGDYWQTRFKGAGRLIVQ